MINTFIRLFCFMLLLIMIGMPVFGAGNFVLLDNCDSAKGWMNGPSLDSKEFTEGKGSIIFKAGEKSDSFVVYKTFGQNGVNATGMNTLEFDIYFSDLLLAAQNSYFAVEISSSGTWDNNEIEWGDALKYYIFKEGWNHVVLPFSHGSYSNTKINLSDVNFIRFFMLGIYGFEESAATVRLDNIILSSREYNEVHIELEAAPGTVSPLPETGGMTGEITEKLETEAVIFKLTRLPVIAAILALTGMAALITGLTQKKLKSHTVRILFAVSVCLFTTALFVLIFYFAKNTGGETVISGTFESETNAFDPYAVHFKETPNNSLPHVLFSETPASGGITVKSPTGESYTYINIKGYDSWILEKDRKTDKSTLIFTADDETRSAYSGGDIHAVLYYYIHANVSVIISYEKSDGTIAEVTAELGLGKDWHRATIRLDDCVLRGNIDGGDFKLSLKTMEMMRISYFGIDKADEDDRRAEDGAVLVIQKYDSQSYIVADTNVKHFGAAGEGKTDDTNAFKEAIRYAASLGGGTVFVPEGRYAITSFLELPTSVSLVGELKPGGSTEGSILCAYYGKNDENAESFIRLNQGSAIKNIAIYYPEQRFIEGKPIPFPYTIEQIGVEGVCIENIVLVNSYNGIDFGEGSDSLQTVRYLYGTPLNNGYIMNACWDIARLENIYFSPQYWLESGLEYVPDAETLKNYMLSNTVGMIVQRVDWTYFADIHITGCYIGLKLESSEYGAPNGHIYNLNLTGCFYGLYADSVSEIGMIITGCTITTDGGEGSVAVYCTENFNSDITFNSSSITSEGRFAIYNCGSGVITVFDSVIKSSDTIFMRTGSYSMVNVELDMPDKGKYKILYEDTVKPSLSGSYNRYTETKPSSKSFINITAPPYNARSGDDITAVLQRAIDSLKGIGGLVYLPAGSYYIENAITVHAGVELRGSFDAPHFNGVQTAQILTGFGRDNPEGDALFTLYDNSGMRGINVYYYNQKTADIHPYSFTIRGNGSGIYLCNLMLSSSYNGVDFASYRCDNHYVEYIWGAPAFRGIIVGAGSENGIIRDVHYTPNCWHGDGVIWDESYKFIMANSEPFVIGESKGQILYHNFVYGAFRGLTLLDGAKEAYIVAHGVDSGNFSFYAEGDCTAELVNTQLVNLNGADMNYIYTDKSFKGILNLINTNMWGTPKDSVIINGSGKLNLFQGTVLSAGSRFLIMNAGEVTVAGIHVKQRNIKSDILAEESITKITAFANIFGSGGKHIINASDDKTDIK